MQRPAQPSKAIRHRWRGRDPWRGRPIGLRRLALRRRTIEVQFYAFDMLAGDGDDLRSLPLSLRKTNLARLLAAAAMASSSRHSSMVRSGRTCSETPARWTGGNGLEAPGSPIPSRPVTVLGEGQEPGQPGNDEGEGNRMGGHGEKITFAEMRSTGNTSIIVYCSDFRCSHHAVISAEQWPDEVRLSDIEPHFVCSVCGTKGAEIRPARPAK